MSVLDVREIAGQDGEHTDSDVRTYTRKFRVITSDPFDDVKVAGGSFLLPRLFNPYVGLNGSVDLGAWCRSVKPVQDTENPQIWIVTCTYSSKWEKRDAHLAGSVNDPNKPPDFTNPLSRPSKIWFDGVPYQVAVTSDIYGELFTNSAGIVFDPPPEKDDTRPTLVVERNEPSYDPALGVAYQDAVSSDNFFGFNPGCAKMHKIKAHNEFENGVLFWVVTYEIHFRRETWDTRALDKGTYTSDVDGNGFPVPGTLKPIKDSEQGGMVTQPVLLDGAGKVLAFKGTPIYIRRQTYKPLPFNALRLP